MSSDRQQLAEHGTGLCVAGLAALGVSAPPLIPLAVLAAWGLDRFRSCKDRRTRATIDTIVKQIEKSNPDHRAVAPALALLKDNRHKVTITAAHLANAETRGDFPNALYDIVFKGVSVPTDDGVEALLRMILTTAWQDLRLEDAYNKVFLQEGITALERDLADGFSRIEAKLDQVQRVGSDTNQRVRSLETMVSDLKDMLGSSKTLLSPAAQDLTHQNELIEALASRYASETPDNLQTALLGMAQALETSASKRDSTAPHKGKGLDITTLSAELETLNSIGRLDDAQAALGAAAQAHNTDARALSELSITQAMLAGNSAAVAEVERKRCMNNDGPQEVFEDLLMSTQSWCTSGQEKGIAFNLAVAIACARHACDWAQSAPNRFSASLSLGTALLALARLDGHRAGLDEAARVLRSALTDDSDDLDPTDRVSARVTLANILLELSERISGDYRYPEAAILAKDALTLCDRQTGPRLWGHTTNALGTCLVASGRAFMDPAHIRAGIANYEAASQVLTEDMVPLDWARGQASLGDALLALHGCWDGDDALLDQATTAYRNAKKHILLDRIVERSEIDLRLGEAIARRARSTLDFGDFRSALVHVADAQGVFYTTRSTLSMAVAESLRMHLMVTRFYITGRQDDLEAAATYAQAARTGFEQTGASRYLAALAEDEQDIVDARATLSP
ncbi:hypothetical protein [Jannaschia sp. CCS1]|uniref:hypothetical protein n=1 Tax=Jannaschia sp. (strain CCS1) TaxID=290400 RepID=UPI000053BD1C|nr:hypothetical protein [Jannaschia sp. CCS1]ABD54781.1 hypothetical protein Jann_1864 [Jannaschia sp. CCS1]